MTIVKTDKHGNYDCVLPEGDYLLADGAAWFTVGPFAVRIKKTDEGIGVDVYGDGKEDQECIASCWALDGDIPEDEPEGV